MMNMIAPESINLATLPSIALENRRTFPQCSCIYIARSGEEILYIGKAINLAQRWRQHHRQAELESMEEVKITWLEVSDPGLLPVVEKALIQYFKPQLNGQSVAVHQRKQNLERADYKTRFKNSDGITNLSKNTIGVKLPKDIHAVIRAMRACDRSVWLRRIITEAAKKELI
jgi:GIY-YIG catalytic domain